MLMACLPLFCAILVRHLYLPTYSIVYCFSSTSIALDFKFSLAPDANDHDQIISSAAVINSHKLHGLKQLNVVNFQFYSSEM